MEDYFKYKDIIIHTNQYVWGDGTHPTTIHCLEILNKLDLKNKKVLDIGTGTGIQSIVAKKLGAEEVLGVDINPGAIGLAEYNAKKNGVDVRFEMILSEDDINYKADVIITNLEPHVLNWHYLPNIKRFMNKGCKLITVMPKEFDMIVELNNNKYKYKITDKYIDTYCVFLIELED